MRRGEAIAVRFTPTREWAMRVPSESDTGMEREPKLLNRYEPTTRSAGLPLSTRKTVLIVTSKATEQI